MPDIMVVSQVLLWVVVIVQGLFLLALARQIGLFHQRFAATGARVMDTGLRVGERAPQVLVDDIRGRDINLGMQDGKTSLFVFISTACSICESLLPKLQRLNREEKGGLEVRLIAFGSSPEDVKKYEEEHSLSNTGLQLINSDELARQFKVTIAPYGMVIDRSGVVRAKGLLNSPFDIESLLNAEELGVKSIQQYVEEKVRA